MRLVSGLVGPGVVLVALFVATLVFYRGTAESFVRLWTGAHSPAYHHGFLVLGMCAVLGYRRWLEAGASLQVRPSLTATLLVALASLLWLLASLVHVLAAQQLSLALLVCLTVASMIGYRSAMRFTFPAALFIFAVPVWEPLIPPLQWFVANTVTILVNGTGIPAFLQGTSILVPAGTFVVEPACSGLAQVIVGAMGGVLFAYVNRLARASMTWAVAATVAIALLSNVLRIYTVVVVGELSEMRHSLVKDHLTLGWVYFGAGMVGFVLWASRFVGDDDRPAKALTPPATGSWVKENAGTHIATSAVLTLLALAIGPALMSGYRVDRDAMRPPHLDLSEEISGWRAVTVPADAYRPVFTGSDAEYERIFRSDGDGEVYLYVAQYAYQEQGKEAVSETNGVHDPKRWTAELARTLRLPNGVTVRQTRIRSHGGTEKLVWQWYHVHGRTVSSDYLAKLLNAWGTLGGDPAIAVVVVAAELDGNDDRAAARLSRFVAEAWQTVERAIEHAPKRQRSAGSALSPRT